MRTVPKIEIQTGVKLLYSDVIKKELVVFKEKFKDELMAEGVVVEVLE